MDKLRLAWAAGIIDGEGCFSIRLNRASEKTRCAVDQYALIAKVAMCHEETVRLLHSTFGRGSLYTVRAGDYYVTRRRRQQWIWECTSRNAAAIIEAVLPYLVTKRGEAEIALTFSRLPTARNGRARTPPELTQRRHDLYLQLRAAKGRLDVPAPKLGEPFVDARPRPKPRGKTETVLTQQSAQTISDPI